MDLGYPMDMATDTMYPGYDYVPGGTLDGGIAGADWLKAFTTLGTSALGGYTAIELTKARNASQLYDPFTGMRYIPGQPITRQPGAMVITPMMMLLIGGVILFAMKD